MHTAIKKSNLEGRVGVSCECGQTIHYWIHGGHTRLEVWHRKCNECRKPLFSQEERDLYDVMGDFSP